MKYIFSGILIFILFFFTLNVSSEVAVSLNNMAPPITELYYNSKAPKAGDTLYLKIIIPEGWHINADSVSENFLIPSKVETQAEGMEFGKAIWPKPQTVYNDILNKELFLLQGEFIIKLPIIYIQQNLNPYKVSVDFTFQACSEICLPPKTIEISFNEGLKQHKEENYINNVKNNEDKSEQTFLFYFLIAFIGGLLLNVMPCVLPVIFLKIFSLMQKKTFSRQNMLVWGFATTAGICFAFLVLAVIVFIARLTGNNIGWGFQFQQPAYIATMVLLLGIFALNLWGLFKVWIPGMFLKIWDNKSKKEGFTGAFAYGILIVLLSTPCSAPFLGLAITYALTTSYIKMFVIFFTIAIGLALPYIILGIFPKWKEKLPRPGNWMIVLNQFLGFIILISAGWLSWVFYKQNGADSFFKFCALIYAAIFFAWFSGKFATPNKSWWRFVATWATFILICVLSLNLWILPKQENDNHTKETIEKTLPQETQIWKPFSKKVLDSLQNEGIAVWVNGTADWCITCKANEKYIFENERINKIFEEKAIVKMQADYTNTNNEALIFFKTYNRSGVPFDILLTPKKEAILMPELLNVDTVISALDKVY